MWLKEKEFVIRLGGSTFIDVETLIAFNDEPLFSVTRHEDSGDLAIDCDIYNQVGEKIASVRRNNIYQGNKSAYEVVRTPVTADQLSLVDKASGSILVDIKRRGSALPAELDISLHTYLPDGRMMILGPESSNIAGLMTTGCVFEGCTVGITVYNPNLLRGKEYKNEDIRLDGKTFVNCKFSHCRLFFGATGPISLWGNDVRDSSFIFEGPALMTVEFMTMLYRMGAADVVNDIFGAIRGETGSPAATT